MDPSQRIACCLVLLLAGCQQFDILRSQNPETETASDEEFKTRLKTKLIGDYTIFSGLNRVVLQNAGLVVGLDGTGGDPPPSVYRSRLLRMMRKEGITKPNTLLRSPTTALVVVRGYLPPLVEKGETFDVEVRLPGNSKATSLRGGWLMPTYLSERAIVAGRGELEGHVLAKATGPILISTGQDDEASLAGVLRRGTILGGGHYLKEDRHMNLHLRNDFRSIRNATRLAQAIGKRFYYHNRHGIKEPLAEAKTDQKIELKLHPRYKENIPRFLQVVRHIGFHESDVARRVRMKRLREMLQSPSTAQEAALQLEAIGTDAVPILKSGLKNERLEVRFHAAMALAYLGEPAGISVLAEAARKEPAFRVFALAAMSAIDVAESHIALRKLLHGDSAETRYGAFRALTTLNKNDPSIRGQKLNDRFMLHVLETTGDPLIHLTHRRKAEVVLFGADQRFHTPLAVQLGKHIQVTAPAGSDTVTVSRHEVSSNGEVISHKKELSTRIAEVIRTVASPEFGASYPDVAQMLVQADSQNNLPGRLAIDALPQSGRVYHRPEAENDPSTKARSRMGRSKLIPNLFDAKETGTETAEPAVGEAKSATGTASLADFSRPQAENETDLKERADGQASPANKASRGWFDWFGILAD